MFFTEDDDGDFASPSPAGGSKLASLFGMSGGSKDDNESLTYTAPKKPKGKDKSDGKTEQIGASPSLLYATAAHTFRFHNGQYVKQGKLGMAVLGDHKNKDYKILLYVSQKQPVSAAKIHPGFNFTVQKNNYANFYDDQSQLWSICFDNSNAASEFAKWVALTKFNCSPVGLLSQDLILGDGQPLNKGDTAELQYTGNLYTNQSFGKVFESNKDSGKLYKMKLGRGKVIKGWEEGIPGMKKGGRRFLIIPPGLAYGSKGVGERIPPNSILMFEIGVTRAKFANPDPQFNDDSISTNSVDAAQTQETKSSTPQKADGSSEKLRDVEPTTPLLRSDSLKSGKGDDARESLGDSTQDISKGRTHSLSEQLSKSLEKSSGKAELLARMSKMGQAMIASPSTTSDDHETVEITEEDTAKQRTDSDAVKLEDVDHRETVNKPVLKPRPEHSAPHARNSHDSPGHQAPQSNYNAAPAMAAQQQQLIQPPAIYQPPQQMFGMHPLQGMAYAQQIPTMQTVPTSSTSNEMSLLISESKIHHGEIKSAVSRVTERIDDLILKVDRLEKSGTRQDPSQPMIAGGVEMEASVLSSNIMRILQENDKLKKDCKEKTKKIEGLNERISDMLLKSQSFMERSNELMEQRADSIKNNTTNALARVNTLENENMSLTSQVASLKTKSSGFESELEEANKKQIEMKANIKKLKEERDSARERLESASSSVSDHKEELEQVQNKYKEEKQEKKKLKIKMDHLEEELQELKQEKESVEKALNERKKKQQTDRKKFEEEIEEIKNTHDEELKSLKQRYKKGSLESEKIAALEAELETRHQEHLKKVINEIEEKLEEKCQEISGERDKAKMENIHLNEKIEKLRSVEETNIELERMVEGLQSSSHQASFKLQEEIEEYKRKLQYLNEKYESIEDEAYNKGIEKERAEGRAMTMPQGQGENEASKSLDAAEEVKKVMNGVFFKLKGEFEPDEDYSGSDVIKQILQTIRDVTLKMTEEAKQGPDLEEEVDEDEEESEEEESEVEESEVEESASEDEDEEDEAVGGESSEEEAGYLKTAEGEDTAPKDDNVKEVTDSGKMESEQEGHGEQGSLSQESTEMTEESQHEQTDEIRKGDQENIIVDDVMDDTGVDGNDNNDNDVDTEVKRNQIVLEAADKGQPSVLENSDNDNSQEAAAYDDDVDDDMFEIAQEKVNGTKSDINDSGINTEESPKQRSEDSANENLDSSKEEIRDSIEVNEKEEATAKDHELASKTIDSSAATNECDAKKPSLFEDDDDDDIFSTSSTSAKKSKPSAFNRSPPPLFDDDDDDTNWI